MDSGDALHYWTTGGAGRESPAAREAGRVLDDVLDGRVSPQAAREVYKVAIEDARIDADATARLRAATTARQAGAAANAAP